MLEGRIAVVTGASRGLGRVIASTLLEAGASIGLVARPSPDLDETAATLVGQRRDQAQHVLAVPADLAEPSAASAIVETIYRSFHRIDILVNNAAVTGPIGPFESNEARAWRTALAVNLFAPVELMRAVIPGMRAQRYGKIINLSGGGATSPRANFSAYAAAKTALVRVTETVAQEVSGGGIDVNAIAPGALNTRMLQDVLAAGPALVGQATYDAALAQAREGGGSPQRAADLVLFLVSREGDGISGRLISAIWDPWQNLAERREALAGTDIYTLRRIVPADRGRDWNIAK